MVFSFGVATKHYAMVTEKKPLRVVSVIYTHLGYLNRAEPERRFSSVYFCLSNGFLRQQLHIEWHGFVIVLPQRMNGDKRRERKREIIKKQMPDFND